KKVNLLKHTEFQADKLNIRLVNSKIPDSQAIGSNTILLTDGLLMTATEDELKAVIAHELWHLYNRDSFILAILIFGGLATRIIMWLNAVYTTCRKLLAAMVGKFGKKGLHLMPVITFIPLIIFLPVIILNWIVRWLLDISLRLMCRQYTYKADKFAKEVGYKDGLISYLETAHIITNPDDDLWKRLSAAHPSAMKRISKLERI
ncbi:MAG TPA: M48 family metalloprotease, partial [Aquella sp.]|nr:M48 family metalloprotease [Aquella sp.]